MENAARLHLGGRQSQPERVPVEDLEQTLPLWAQEHFGDEEWTFQQDSAPSHKALDVQEWCKANPPGFITFQEWPLYSLDLNPLNPLTPIWSILESKACAKPHNSLGALQRSLKRELEALPLDIVMKVFDNFPKGL